MVTIYFVKSLFLMCFGCLLAPLVLSQEPPVILNCPLNTFVSSSPNKAFWVEPTVADNEGAVTLTSDRESGSYFGFGQTQVTYTAIDEQDLQSQCTFTVSVSATGIPTAGNCPDDITVTLGAGETTTSVSWVPPFATDPDVPVSRNTNKDPGDEFSLGFTTVKYTFVDSTDLGVECKFVVEVKDAGTSDTTPPTFTYCPSDQTVSSNTVVSWTEPIATDNSGTVFYSRTHASGDQFPVGSTNVVYYAVDIAGNRATCTFTVTIADTSDTTKPTFTYCPDDISASTPEGTSSTSVTWTEPTAVDDSGSVFYTRTHASGDQFFVGTTTVTYFARDPSQNQETCIFTVTVNIANQSLVTNNCPSNQAILINKESNSATVTWMEPTFTNERGTIIATPNYLPGGLFPLGTTVVSYTAIDGMGRQGICTFSITITVEEATDSSDPTFTYCPNNLSAYTAEGTTSTSVTWREPVATDDSGSVFYTKTHATGDTFVVGKTTVLYYAADPSGNRATCSFAVTVLVNSPPVSDNCPSDQTIQANLGSTTATATWVEPTFSDDLGPVTPTSNYNPGDVFPEGTTLVTYTATDLTGLQGTCTFNVVVEGSTDSTSPTFTFCPNNLSAYASEGVVSTAVSWRAPEATDNSGSVIYDKTHSPGDQFNVGRTFVEYIASDSEGNTARCAFTVTVIVNQRPSSENCPSDQTITAAESTNSATATWTEPTFSDELGPVVSTSNYEPGDAFVVGTTIVIYTATDVTGQQGTCSFQVTVEEAADTSKPIFTYCPDDISAYAIEGTTSTLVTWIEPTAIDNSGSVFFGKTHTSGDTFPLGDSSVVYLARDPSANTESCSFTVTVTVNNRPVTNNCPSDQTIPANDGVSTATATWVKPTFIDDSGIIVPTSNYQPGDLFILGTTVVTYIATDPTGTQGTCLFSITVQDTQAPQVFNCPTDITTYVESGVTSATVTWVEPVATDNDVVDTLVSNYNSPATLPVGEYDVVYVARDPSGNVKECSFKVSIVARQAPIFTNFPEHKLFDTDPGLPTAIVTWTAPSVSSPYNPQPIVTSSHNPGDIFLIGVTTVAYNAVDSFGAVTTQEFTVTVTDNEAPQIVNCPSDFTILVSSGEVSSTVTWAAPTAADNDEIKTFVSNYDSPHVFPLGDREVVYVATDDAGNYNDCKFVVTVTEQQPPVFVDFPIDQIVFNDRGLPSAVVGWVEPSVIYTSDPPPTVVSSRQSWSDFPLGLTVVTYTAVDSAGLVTDKEFQVTVLDNEDPVFEDCPSVTIDGYAPADSPAPIQWTRPIAIDNSGDVTLVGNFEPGDEFDVGFHLITYIAIDEANNDVSCTFILHVIEDTPPVLANLPTTIYLNTEPGQPGAVVTWPMPTATDDRSTPTITVSHPSGTQFPIGTTLVTVTALDAEGLTDVHTFQVTVHDNEDPVISGCDDVTITVAPGNTTARAYWTPPTATDNSGQVTVSGSHSPGDEFPVGTLSIAYLAVDSSNNQAMCAVTITVRELGYPVFTNCPSAIFVGTDAGKAFAIITWPVVEATDELDPPTVISSHDSGDSFTVGVTTVFYTAADSDGLTATCSFDVSVSDLEDPVITNCPSDISMYIVDASRTARVWWTEPIATDNVGSVEISSTDRPGDSFPEGESVVIYVAQDTARNSYTCLFSVDLVIPAETTAYNASISLDRIRGSTISSTDGNNLLTQELMSDLDAFVRTTVVSDDFVGLDDMTVNVINPIGLAALKFSFHVTKDSAHSSTDIEAAFDADLPNNQVIATGNRVVAATFIVGPGPCAADPCNRGTCERVGRDNYYCVCPTGWYGFRCDNDVNECEELGNPCDGDYFQCVNTQGSYSCLCQAGYYQDGDICIKSRNFASCFQLERINNQAVQYTNDLSDTRTDGYQQISLQVRDAIDSVFDDHTDYFESSIVSFAPGSNIQVCYQVHFHGNSLITEDLVLDEFIDDVSNSGEITDSNIYVKSSSLAQTSEVCPISYCESNGDCYLDRDAVVQQQAVVSACTCNSGYSGDNCSKVTIFTTFVIIVIALVSAVLLVLLFVCIFCCILTWGDKRRKPVYMASNNNGNHVNTIRMEDGDMGGGERVHVVGGGPVNPSVDGVEMGRVNQSASCVRFMDQGVVNTGIDSPDNNWSLQRPPHEMRSFQEDVVPPPPMQAAPPPPPPPPPPQTNHQPVYIQEPAPVEYIYSNYPPENYPPANYPPERQRSMSPVRRGNTVYYSEPPRETGGNTVYYTEPPRQTGGNTVYYTEPPRQTGGNVVYYTEPPRQSVVRKKTRKSRKARKAEQVLVTSYPEGYQQVVVDQDGNPVVQQESRRSRKSKRPVGSVKPSVRRTKKSRPVQRAYTQQRGGDYYYQKGYEGPVEEIPLQYLEGGFRPDAINPVTSGPRFIALNESFRSDIDYDPPGLQTVPEDALMRSYSYSQHAPPPPPPPPPLPQDMSQGPAFTQGPAFKSDYGTREKQPLEPPLYTAVDRQASVMARQQRASRREQHDLMVDMGEEQYGNVSYPMQRTPSTLVREHDAVWEIPPKGDEGYDDGRNNVSEDYF